MTPTSEGSTLNIPTWLRIVLAVVGASAFIAALVIAYKMEGSDPSSVLSLLVLGAIGYFLLCVGAHKSTPLQLARRQSATPKKSSRLWGLAMVSAGLFMVWYIGDLYFRLIDGEFADRPADLWCAIALMLMLGASTYGYIAGGAKRLMAPRPSNPDMPTPV